MTHKLLTSIAAAMLTCLSLAAQEQTFTPDWSCSFNKQSEFDQFTVIDANGDQTTSGNMFFTYIDGTWSYTNTVYKSAYYRNAEENAADDWLITPGLNLSAGTSYRIAYQLKAGNHQTPERIEVKWGSAATVEGMTWELMAPTMIANEEYEEYEQIITATADGTYYIGFHAISDANQYFLYLDEISVTALASSAAPSAIADLSVAPDATAALRAELRMTTPAADMVGSALTANVGIRLLRNGEAIATMTDVTPGSAVTYTDETVPQAGTYTYTATAFNASGDGDATTATAYVGLDTPAMPTKVRLADEQSQLRLTWETPKGAHGGVIFADGLTYNIYKVEWDEEQYGYFPTEQVAQVTGLTTAIIAMDTDEGDQRMVQYAVRAANDAGQSDDAGTNAVVVGQADAVPYVEGFAGDFAHFWTAEGEGDGVEASYAGYYFAEEDADGDGHSMAFQGYNYDYVTLYSGKISLAGAANPRLVFHHKAEKGSSVVLSAIVMRPNGQTEVVKTIAYAGTDGQWQAEKIELDETLLQERYVRVAFAWYSPAGRTFQQAWLDGVRLSDLPANDLKVSLLAEEEAVKGQPTTIAVRIDNLGDSEATACHLLLSVGDDVVADETLPQPIASFGTQVMPYAYTPSLLLMDGELEITATVTTDAVDATPDDNTARQTLTLTDPKLSPAESLEGTLNALGQPVLSWLAPQNPIEGQRESFETYTPWSTANLGDWTLTDRDYGLAVGLFTDLTLDIEDKPWAFCVFNPYRYSGFDITSYYPNMRPEHGQQYAAAFASMTYAGEYKDADNWLISPLLHGGAQTVSFWVNNFAPGYDYPETFEVLYSTTDSQTDSFSPLGEAQVIGGGQWQQIVADLPEGALYFAIRHVSKADDVVAFFVDDVAFETPARPISHYCVYRDGAPIATTELLTYTDAEAPAGEHLYQLTVVYGDGIESAPLSVRIEAQPTATGIEAIDRYSIEHSTLNIDDSAQNTDHSVYDLQGRRIGKCSMFNAQSSMNKAQSSMFNVQSTKGVRIIKGRKVVH